MRHLSLFGIVFIAIALVVALLGGLWVMYLRTAHSTFENYYAFRGCTQLLEKTDEYGTCKLSDGKVIKLVKFNERWYLDGDLPQCDFGICW
ncbi:MAG: hypothetical protein AAB920_01570 [Patescibacteria group bacterium]